MSIFPEFNIYQIEAISRILGEEVNGSQLSDIFSLCNIVDTYDSNGTKWRRIYYSLIERQKKDHCGNNIANFILNVINPARYSNDPERHASLLLELNKILILNGFELDKDCIFTSVKPARNPSEAEQRLDKIKNKLRGRNIHKEVLKYCQIELLQDNYFHAVFEASKGLIQRIREITGLNSDGSRLIDEAFNTTNKWLCFNKLETQSEISEHNGFVMLLKGCYSAIRNPMAHEPKILWEGEEDVADYLTLISMLHRKLDNVINVRNIYML